jgi:hypothetical protein
MTKVGLRACFAWYPVVTPGGGVAGMLTRQENELLCRVGTGTPMGDLMRQYWLPGILSKELPTPDSKPRRIILDVLAGVPAM